MGDSRVQGPMQQDNTAFAEGTCHISNRGCRACDKPAGTGPQIRPGKWAAEEHLGVMPGEGRS